MAINYIQFSAASATDGVTVAADTMDVGTATGVEVQLIKFGYGTDEVYKQVATGAGLPVQADPSNPVFVKITGSGTATQAVDISTWSATDLNVAVATEVKLATTSVLDIAAATDNIINTQYTPTATQTVIITSGDVTAAQGTHDSLNANANIQVGDTDVAAANPVWVRIAASGTATQAVAVTAWSATDLNVNIAQTATVAITGAISVIGVGPTATQPVSIAGTVPVSVATEVKLATDNVIDVSAATTATQAVEVQNTATVAITGSVSISWATASVATYAMDLQAWSATDLNVNLAQTATVDIAAGATMTVSVSGDASVINATATSFNAIVRLAAPRSKTSYAFNSVTGTDSTTLVTATANAYKDMTAIHVVNGGTANLGIIIKPSATATAWHHELAGDGGGFTLSLPTPIPQNEQATDWKFELDADTSGATPVSIFAQFVTVT